MYSTQKHYIFTSLEKKNSFCKLNVELTEKKKL
jgi:hypothetical protein